MKVVYEIFCILTIFLSDFFILDDHAFLTYDHIDDTTIDLQQVVTPPAFQGQGIASLLVKVK